MQERAVCLIGYQEIPADKCDHVYQELKREVHAALDDGYRTFLAEFKEGVGVLFIQCIEEAREQHTDIFLEVMIPAPKQCSFSREEQELCSLLSKSDGIFIQPDDYQADYPLAVTRYLVGRSHRVIAVHTEPLDRNTAYAMDYALTMERDLKVIAI